MRARVRRLGCGLAVRMLGRRKACSLVLLPAMVAAATAACAADAVAAPGDWRWEGRRHAATHAVRYREEWQAPARPRKRLDRAGARRAGDRQRRAAGRRRARTVAVRSARVRPRAMRPAPWLPAADAAVQIRPLQQRSLVASHPLFPDAAVAAPPAPAAGRLAPRCRSVHANVFELALAGIAGVLQLSEPAMVGGASPHCRSATNPQTRWRHAHWGHGAAAHRDGPHPSDATESLDWIHWRASASCLASPLRAVLEALAGEFGPLTVNSTCRSRAHNRRVGGASRSYHLTGNAVDFRVRGNFPEVHAFLKTKRVVGGLAHYGGGVFHIDTGPRRTWAPGSWSGARVRSAGRGARRG